MEDKKIKNILITEGSTEDDGWGGGSTYSIKVEKVFEDDNTELIEEMSFSDGEPEDNNLCRNFNEVYNIKDLVLKMATMLQGVEIIEQEVTLTEDNDWPEDEEDEGDEA